MKSVFSLGKLILVPLLWTSVAFAARGGGFIGGGGGDRYQEQLYSSAFDIYGRYIDNPNTGIACTDAQDVTEKISMSEGDEAELSFCCREGVLVFNGFSWSTESNGRRFTIQYGE